MTSLIYKSDSFSNYCYTSSIFLVEMLTAGHGAEPIMIDTTPPVAGYVLDGDTHLQDMTYQPYDDRMCVQRYEWFDAESGIDR